MPQVHDGIGTWYWGKRNIRVRRDTCSQCGRVTDLKSYDTTLFFVIFFIPILPLRRLRVLEQCSLCTQHRRLGLKKWNEARKAALGEVMPGCHDNPADAEHAFKAIGTSIAFEDDRAFVEIASLVSEPLAEDAKVQSLLGCGYAFFGHKDLADLSLRTSLGLKDDPEVGMQLGLHLLRTGRTDEGWEIMRPLVTREAPDRVGAALLAVMAFQAEGRHGEALAVMDQCVQVSPELERDKWYKKTRRASEKHKASGKKVGAALAGKDGGWGKREHPILARAPLAIAALILLGVIGVYLGGSWYRGKHREVYLLSGLDAGSSVQLDGKTYTLSAQGTKKISIAEGTHQVSVTSGALASTPVSFTIETPFWTRMFVDRTYVVNADQLALLGWERAVYAPTNSSSGPQPEQKLYVGKVLYEFEGLDYEFVPFPSTISTQQQSGTISKERIDSFKGVGTLEAWRAVAGLEGPEAARAWIRRAVVLRPDDPDVFYVLLSTAEPEEALAVVRPLQRMPTVYLEAHRTYQEIMERAHPEHDLTAEYRALLAAHASDPQPGNTHALQYLLGRVTHDAKESEALFAQAVAEPAPCVRAYAAIAYARMATGRFEEALGMMQRAAALRPNDTALMVMENDILTALGRESEVLARPHMDSGNLAPAEALAKAELLIGAGREAEVQAWLDEYESQLRADGAAASAAAWRRCAEAVAAYAAGRADPLAQLDQPGKPEEALGAQLLDGMGLGGMPFRSAVTGGRLEEAAKQIEGVKGSDARVAHLLVYVAARVNGDEAAAGPHLEAAIKDLGKGGWEERQLAGWLGRTEPPPLEEVLQMPIDMGEKAVVLTVVGMRYPEVRGEVFGLAGKLNFERAFPHLLLKRAMEKEWPGK